MSSVMFLCSFCQTIFPLSLSLSFPSDDLSLSLPGLLYTPYSKQTILGTYFNAIMFMVASSVVTTIMVLNYHHRLVETHEMPDWVKLIFLQWAPWLLRMSRPGEKITRRTIQVDNSSSISLL